jgi:hypothetical protein
MASCDFGMTLSIGEIVAGIPGQDFSNVSAIEDDG